MKRILGFIVLAAATGLSACEPDNKPAVSLEQAKQITAQFQGQGFTPPPRTIADITAILDQQKPDPAKAEAALKAADAQLPTGLQDIQLAQFYFQRGIAAGEVGRITQRIEDLRQAADIGRRLRHPQLSRYLAELSQAELRGGQFKAALAARQEQIRVLETGTTSTGQLFSAYALMSIMSGSTGDIESANSWLSRGDRLRGEAQGWGRGTVYPLWGTDWEASLEQGRAFLAENTGRYADAERSFRRTVSLITESEKVYPQRAATGNAPPPGTYENWKYGSIAALARTILRQGRVVEAEVEARKALIGQLQLRGRYASETAEALGTMTMVLMEQGRHPEAQKLAEAAVDIYEKIGHSADSAGDGARPGCGGAQRRRLGDIRESRSRSFGAGRPLQAHARSQCRIRDGDLA